MLNLLTEISISTLTFWLLLKEEILNTEWYKGRKVIKLLDRYVKGILIILFLWGIVYKLSNDNTSEEIKDIKQTLDKINVKLPNR